MTPHADTICAVATPPGRGGIGVVRASGPACRQLAGAVCGRLPEPRRAVYTRFRDAGGDLIDTGLALFFPGPNSFTGEDVLEFQAHGSPVVLEALVEALVTAGARRAGPGEFTRRAYENDRMDLAQAEAVAALIEASSAHAARAAQRSLEGEFSAAVVALAGAMTELRMWIEAALDFPDEEIDFLADERVLARVRKLRADLADVIARAEAGRMLTDGLRVAIVGRPNAGKSSLLNALARREAAIVTEIPGTTRDVLRESVLVAGMPVVLADTAGLRETSDRVEAEGVRRAEAEMAAADLVIWVVDDTEGHATPPPGLPETAPVLRVDNKIDLSGAYPGRYRGGVRISAANGSGLDALVSAVRDSLGLAETGGGEYAARRRHVASLETARKHVETGLAELEATGSGELLAEELRLGAEALGEITGRVGSDELLGRIFSSFCIGK